MHCLYTKNKVFVRRHANQARWLSHLCHQLHLFKSAFIGPLCFLSNVFFLSIKAFGKVNIYPKPAFSKYRMAFKYRLTYICSLHLLRTILTLTSEGLARGRLSCWEERVEDTLCHWKILPGKSLCSP